MDDRAENDDTRNRNRDFACSVGIGQHDFVNDTSSKLSELGIVDELRLFDGELLLE